MNVLHLLIIILVVIVNVFIVNAEGKDRCDNVKTSLNVLRKRRHLAFPEGTSMVVYRNGHRVPFIPKKSAVPEENNNNVIIRNRWCHEDYVCRLTMSVLKTVMVHAPSGWNVAAELDVFYPLLSPAMTTAFYRRKLHHRQKREFWEKMERALEHYNLNGRSCIYRSICEARTHLAPPGKSLVHDILRTIFTAPVHEKGFKEEINETYYELLEPNVCERIHDCPISILEVILGLNKNSYI